MFNLIYNAAVSDTSVNIIIERKLHMLFVGIIIFHCKTSIIYIHQMECMLLRAAAPCYTDALVIVIRGNLIV
jgi:hypothetical protein